MGSALAGLFKKTYPRGRIVAFDNLKRRGSEINLARFKRIGVEFIHGDVRIKDDLWALPDRFDALIEASAEPSVAAGINGDPNYALQTNLAGTLNCLEFARRRAGAFVFLSTSRVYSMDPLQSLLLKESRSRYDIAPRQKCPGASARGIAENFPTHLPRSIYGATKLS